VVKDLIENYYVLFRVDSISREKEKKMQDALEHFHLGNTKRKCSGDMKMWIYIWEKDETTAINITVTYQHSLQSTPSLLYPRLNSFAPWSIDGWSLELNSKI